MHPKDTSFSPKYPEPVNVFFNFVSWPNLRITDARGIHRATVP